jgi:tetratricopeptide (TPR) repeat protein
LSELAESSEWVGDKNAAFAAYDEAMRLATDAGDRSLESLARIRRSSTQMLTEPHAMPTERFRAELEEARRSFEELGDDAALATVWTELGMLEWMPCRYDRAVLAAERAIEHARRCGDPRLLNNALVPLIAGEMFGLATPEEGLRTLVELRDELSDSRMHESVVLSVRALYAAMQGSFDEARRLMVLARDVAEAIGAGFAIAAHAEQLGHIEVYAGDVEAAERLPLQLRKNRGGSAWVPRTISPPQAPARSTQALVHAARGEFAETERLASEAVELFADAESPNFQGDAWMDLARVLQMAGKPVEAGHAAGEALAPTSKGNRPASESARAFIDGLSSS